MVEREVASDWLVASDGPFVVALDPQLDDDAPARGTGARGGEPDPAAPQGGGLRVHRPDRLWIDGGAAVLEAARAHAEFIRGETLARRLELGARAPAPDLEQQVDIDGHGVVVGVQRDRDGRTGNGPQPTDRA